MAGKFGAEYGFCECGFLIWMMNVRRFVSIFLSMEGVKNSVFVFCFYLSFCLSRITN